MLTEAKQFLECRTFMECLFLSHKFRFLVAMTTNQFERFGKIYMFGNDHS